MRRTRTGTNGRYFLQCRLFRFSLPARKRRVRLKRITELTGIDLEDDQTRLLLQLTFLFG